MTIPDPRLEPLLADLRARLRPVLGDMPPDAFEALVREIAETKLRWADRGQGDTPPTLD